eukprot:4047489-Amphidinium_carterae.1
MSLDDFDITTKFHVGVMPEHETGDGVAMVAIHLTLKARMQEQASALARKKTVSVCGAPTDDSDSPVSWTQSLMLCCCASRQSANRCT